MSKYNEDIGDTPFHLIWTVFVIVVAIVIITVIDFVIGKKKWFK